MAHPETLGRYTIKTLLGEGAMGVVYKAYDPGIGRLVALKTIRRALSKDLQAETSLVDRFRNEARAVGRINHPGIVAIYDFGQDGERVFIAMEYVEGRDLSQILADNPVLPEVDVLQLMQQLLEALACAHQHGVWHRDIKPANLLITTSGQLKVTDFGIARIESAALTLVTSTIGTPGYMAPEQYMGESFDHRVDLFAAGVLLFRMLAGQAPFSGTPEAVMYGIMTKETPSLAPYVAPDVAAFYDPVVARALAKDPAQRYPSAAAFRDALLRRSPTGAGDSGETTIIVRAAGQAAQALGGPAAHPVSGQTGQTLPTHWEEASLASVQAALARFMGPMARVLVRQAAKTCADMPTLLAQLAQHLAHPEERAQFLATWPASTGYSTAGGGMQVNQGVGDASGGQANQAHGGLVTDVALLDRATRLLARHVGPIAKIMVKKAAAKAASPAQLVELLAQEVPEGPGRVQFKAELS